MVAEMKMRKSYLPNKPLQSIYFGGGTPSVLEKEDLINIFKGIKENFSLAQDAEITLEANPDDLTEEKLKMLAETPINRLSIGVQSFNDDDLKMMNRSHNAAQATQSIQQAQALGFSNITLDLIYGLPDRNEVHWEQQLYKALDLNVPHISAYALTVEKETVLENWIRKGKISPLDERIAERNFYFLIKILQKHGYEHYEVSNFAKKGYRAKHNSSYWQGKPYLGIGPSAHSFNGNSRQWNVSNNHVYLDSINQGELHCEKETLSIAEQYNEKVMTGLRQKEGLDLEQIDLLFGVHYTQFLLKEAQAQLENGSLEQVGTHLVIPTPQRFRSDGIAAALFYI